MPHTTNPEPGFVASANNQPLPSGQAPFLGVDWLDGYRASRIAEIVDAKDDWNIESTAHAQLDTVSMPWREMREVVLAAEPSTTETEQALALLSDWDGAVEIDSTGATVFEFFLTEMVRRVAMAKAPKSWEWAIGRSDTPVHSLTLLSGRRVGHLVNLLRNRPQDWSNVPLTKLIDDSLAAAITELRSRFGNPSERMEMGPHPPSNPEAPSGTEPLACPGLQPPSHPVRGRHEYRLTDRRRPPQPCRESPRVPVDAHGA